MRLIAKEADKGKAGVILNEVAGPGSCRQHRVCRPSSQDLSPGSGTSLGRVRPLITVFKGNVTISSLWA